MNITRNLICFSLLSSLFILTHAATFEIKNQCPYTVWAASLPGGGKQLNPTQSWSINITTPARIWGRTNCTFDAMGSGRCETGDCNGLLQCQVYAQPPITLAEYAPSILDLFDISLVDGFNLPMDFSPTTGACRGMKCDADINGQCPKELRVPGGCNSPCNVFQTDQYCCNSGRICAPTNFSGFFRQRCPDAFSIPSNEAARSFTCPRGTNYRIVFCP